MNGSEKQIALAQEIRDGYRAAVNAQIDGAVAANPVRATAGEAHRAKMMAAIDSINDASFWINNKQIAWGPATLNDMQAKVLRQAARGGK